MKNKETKWKNNEKMKEKKDEKLMNNRKNGNK